MPFDTPFGAAGIPGLTQQPSTAYNPNLPIGPNNMPYTQQGILGQLFGDSANRANLAAYANQIALNQQGPALANQMYGGQMNRAGGMLDSAFAGKGMSPEDIQRLLASYGPQNILNQGVAAAQAGASGSVNTTAQNVAQNPWISGMVNSGNIQTLSGNTANTAINQNTTAAQAALSNLIQTITSAKGAAEIGDAIARYNESTRQGLISAGGTPGAYGQGAAASNAALYGSNAQAAQNQNAITGAQSLAPYVPAMTDTGALNTISGSRLGNLSNEANYNRAAGGLPYQGDIGSTSGKLELGQGRGALDVLANLGIPVQAASTYMNPAGVVQSTPMGGINPSNAFMVSLMKQMGMGTGLNFGQPYSGPPQSVSSSDWLKPPTTGVGPTSAQQAVPTPTAGATPTTAMPAENNNTNLASMANQVLSQIKAMPGYKPTAQATQAASQATLQNQIEQKQKELDALLQQQAKAKRPISTTK